MTAPRHPPHQTAPIRCSAPGPAPGETPPFAAIRPEHFRPAFDRAMASNMAEIEAIAGNTEAASFANTIAALERSGRALSQVSAVFHALAGAHTNDAILALEREMSPRLAAHRNRIQLHGGLYARIKALWERRGELGLTGEQARVLERYEVTFRRAGAGLDACGQAARRRDRRAARHARHRVQPECARRRAVLCPGARNRRRPRRPRRCRPRTPRARRRKSAACRQIRHHAGAFERRAVPQPPRPGGTCGRRRSSPGSPAATAAGRPTTRRSSPRPCGCAPSGRACSAIPPSPSYRLDDAMAKTPEAVRALLERVWQPARARAMADRDALQELAQAEGGNFALAPWDWRHYAEKLRKARFDIDEAEIAPYLCARQHDRGGLRYRRPPVRPFLPRAPRRAGVASRRPGLGGHRPRAASSSGLFFGDYFARPSKRSGAWMTTLRTQEKLAGDIRPLGRSTS